MYDVIYLIGGLILGIILTLLFKIGSKKRNYERGKSDAKNEITLLNERVSSKDQKINELNSELEEIKNKIDNRENSLKSERENRLVAEEKNKRLPELEEKINKKEEEIQKLVEQLKNETEKRSAAEEKNTGISKLENLLSSREDTISDLQKENTEIKQQNSELKTVIEDERKATQEKLEIIDKAREELENTFKALSSEALRNNNKTFLELAVQNLEKFHETSKSDLDKRQKAIDDLVKPLKESLSKVDNKIGEIEKERVSSYSSLTEKLVSLTTTQTKLEKETSNLVKALRAPTVRGRWGEIQLKRVVEMAGMVEYCDFCTQESTVTETGRLRPDMIIKLPNGRNIVVDAKAPLQAYLESIETKEGSSKTYLFEKPCKSDQNSYFQSIKQVILGSVRTNTGICSNVSTR